MTDQTDIDCRNAKIREFNESFGAGPAVVDRPKAKWPPAPPALDCDAAPGALAAFRLGHRPVHLVTQLMTAYASPDHDHPDVPEYLAIEGVCGLRSALSAVAELQSLLRVTSAWCGGRGDDARPPLGSADRMATAWLSDPTAGRPSQNELLEFTTRIDTLFAGLPSSAGPEREWAALGRAFGAAERTARLAELSECPWIASPWFTTALPVVAPLVRAIKQLPPGWESVPTLPLLAELQDGCPDSTVPWRGLQLALCRVNPRGLPHFWDIREPSATVDGWSVSLAVQGYLAAARCYTEGFLGRLAAGGADPVPPLPRYDAEAGMLSFRGRRVLTSPLARQATNVRAVLDQFQQQGWPAAITPNFPVKRGCRGASAREQLRDAVKTLNDRLSESAGVRFIVSCGRISWSE